MVEQQLIDYIRASQREGASSDAIKQDLLSAGWTQSQIDEAYRAVNIPKPPILTPPPSPTKSSVFRKRYTSPHSVMLAVVLVLSLLILVQNAVTDILDHFAPQASGFINSQEYVEYQQEFKRWERGPSSADYPTIEKYQEAYYEWDRASTINRELAYDKYHSKYKENIPSPSYRLILHAGIVLPFWIITFLLFISLKEKRKKYETLLGAYYVTSGWLLIFLFFNVARFVWNSDTVIGVYVVFGMLAVILTGAVWGIQKYRHSLEN